MSVVVVLLDCMSIPLPYFSCFALTCALMFAIVIFVVGRASENEMHSKVKMRDGREPRAFVKKGLVLRVPKAFLKD